MLPITSFQIQKILETTPMLIGEKYEKGFNCIHFVTKVYSLAGIDTDFTNQPRLTFSDLYEEESIGIGYLCFLKHKVHGKNKRFSHIGVIMPNRHLLHYTRYFGEPNVREVLLTPFEQIFEVYDFVCPIFNS